MSKKYELIGLGNAIVDVLAHATDSFLEKQGIEKGAMTLLDEAQARTLYESMGPAGEVSGGSAANTMAGFASFGGKGAYIGKVADDQLGRIFAHDMRATGIHFDTPPLKTGAETGRSLILVTPDGQRSMSTFLGASVEFGEDDVDEALIAGAQMIFLEGYLFDREPAKRAFIKAARAARAAGAKVALTLSDKFCVDRHRDDFQRLIDHDTDILFANEAELLSLCQTDNFDSALASMRGRCEIVAATRSEQGSIIATAQRAVSVRPRIVAKVVDSTGAGDQYAAGFLFGFARDCDLPTCGALGALAASEVISHMGPRPQTCLADLARKELKLEL